MVDLTTTPGYRERACSVANHNVQRGESGYRECVNCGLSAQTIVDDLGHDLRELEDE